MVSLLNSMKCLDKNKWQSFSNTSKTVEEEEIFSNSYEASILLLSKSEKDSTRKENYKLISLMNIDAKILNKIIGSKIQQHFKRIIMIK